MTKMIWKIIAVIVIVVILFSPYLLIENFEKNAPFVFMIWFLSVVYYLVMKKRIQEIIDKRNTEADDKPEEDVNNKTNS